MTYVQNYIGHIDAMQAKDAGAPLRRMGYRESSSPMGINDIVVLQPGLAGASSSGHIAFLAAYSYSGSTVRITLRGTNQPGSTWTDHGCNNVSRWGVISYQNRDGRIKYYRR